jgi:Multiubiquitin
MNNQNDLSHMEDEGKAAPEAKKPGKSIEIIVNTRQRLVDGPTVTFEEIVAIAFPGHHDANVTFSMTFRHAASKPHAGELGAGGIVAIKKGTIFNVTRTVQS